jgi:hypothetical protein
MLASTPLLRDGLTIGPRLHTIQRSFGSRICARPHLTVCSGSVSKIGGRLRLGTRQDEYVSASGDGPSSRMGDTIVNPKLRLKADQLRHLDVVVANPPISLDKWGAEKAATDKFGRFQRGLPPGTKGDYAFIQHLVEKLKPHTGCMAAVVPDGVFFRGSTEGTISRELMEENLLEAVSRCLRSCSSAPACRQPFWCYARRKRHGSTLHRCVTGV